MQVRARDDRSRPKIAFQAFGVVELDGTASSTRSAHTIITCSIASTHRLEPIEITASATVSAPRRVSSKPPAGCSTSSCAKHRPPSLLISRSHLHCNPNWNAQPRTTTCGRCKRSFSASTPFLALVTRSKLPLPTTTSRQTRRFSAPSQGNVSIDNDRHPSLNLEAVTRPSLSQSYFKPTPCRTHIHRSSSRGRLAIGFRRCSRCLAARR
jgi:hypothetical protein